MLNEHKSGHHAVHLHVAAAGTLDIVACKSNCKEPPCLILADISQSRDLSGSLSCPVCGHCMADLAVIAPRGKYRLKII